MAVDEGAEVADCDVDCAFWGVVGRGGGEGEEGFLLLLVEIHCEWLCDCSEVGIDEVELVDELNLKERKRGRNQQ